ncbi:MAG: MBL fold metallo-hydrolase [Methylocystaceae bacterium]
MYATANPDTNLQIRWLGHSCFHIRLGAASIITDPAPPKTGYDILPMAADIVTVSHDHWDHNYLPLVTGEPRVFNRAGKFNFKDINISGLPSFHDGEQGKTRGKNLIFRMEAQGLSIAHMGDLGDFPAPEVMEQLIGLDVLLIPVGGIFTIDADAAYELSGKLKPKMIIPMHFKTKDLTFKLDPVEKFILKFPRVQKIPYLNYINRVDDEPAVVVLDYLLTRTRGEG